MDNSQFFMTVKDYSVSHETFNLYHDQTLNLLYVHPKPRIENLGKYYESDDYISHTDAARSLFEKLYQFIKGITLNRKLQLINSLQKNKGTLLDIGAGTGDFLSVSIKNGWRGIGTEPNKNAQSVAKKKGISLIDDTDSIERHSVDIITMWHVLEHIPDTQKQIAELKRLLKPNGTILVAVPNFNSFDANYYKEFWAAFDVPRHLWHFSKSAIKILFEREQLQLEKILPMPYDAFYVSLLSEKYKTGRMNFIRAIWVGLLSNLKGIRSQEFSSHIYVIRNT